jgi:hypothetical protein
MATHHISGLSNVIEFPIARRAILGSKPEVAKPQELEGDAVIARAFTAAFGEAWYHEAAILEEEGSRQH